ncbi:MAG TPA: XRE family transcriptional regulator [Planctomycetota bacterium]|nr:XRE family transcriptional regulator [Planctomycetota bacterium]
MNAIPEVPKLGKNVQHFRKLNDLSLADLERLSGVSKAMLSQIEQDKTNPTIGILWKIAHALNVGFNELLGNSTPTPRFDVVRKLDSIVIYNDDKSCKIRVIVPLEMGELEVYQLYFEPHGELKSAPHFPRTEEILTSLKGALQVNSAASETILQVGDSVHYMADVEHAIKNTTGKPAEAYLIVRTPKG